MTSEQRTGYSEPATGLRVPASRESGRTDSEPVAALFRFRDLDGYSTKQRLSIALADRAFHLLISAIGPTLRWSFEGTEHLEELYANGGHAIFSFWHNRIFGATWFWRRRGIVVMTSRSLDGEYIARFIQRFGYGAARGSSTRGGGRALIEQDRAVRAGFDVAFTVDGPKGPRYEAKLGPALLARRSGAAIVPMTVAYSGYWQAGSWDRLQIPRPFARAVAAVSKPILVPPDADAETTERARVELQIALEQLQQTYDRQSKESSI